MAREVAAAGGQARYRAWRAQQRAHLMARCPKRPKFGAHRRLRAEVERGLRRRWSPQQISARLEADFADDASMRVSHETIYQSLFVQSRGALRRELANCLRTGRARRRPQGRSGGNGAGELKQMVLLSERPAEADDRAMPGHWEGDLLLGRQSRSAVATLVERRTRFVMLCALLEGRLAEQVKEALSKRILALPAQACAARSLGTAARRWPSTPLSPATPACRSISATRAALGSAAQSRTRTGCCASTSPRAPIWPPTRKPRSTA